MGCDCGKPKCDGHCGVSPAVLQINNPSECVLFHRVEVPASMGDSKTNPPKSGAYKNVLLYYEADQTSWLYSSDGVPQKLVNGLTNYEDAINLPQINGVTLIGNKDSADLKLADAPMVITVANGNTSWSGADTAEDVYDFFLNKGKVNIIFNGDENYSYEIVSAAYIPWEEKMMCTLAVATMTGGETTEFDGNALFGTMTLYTADKAIDVSQIELQPKLYVADFTGLDLGYNELSGLPATTYSIGMVKPSDGLSVSSDGTLTVIDRVFDTVADMKLSTNLVNGSYAQTLGFYSVNDGGGAIYKISSSGTANEMDIIAIGSLFANLCHVSKLNVKQYGAYGDGETDDTDILKYVLETVATDGDTVYLPKGDYLYSDTVTCNKSITLKGAYSYPYHHNQCVLTNDGTGGLVFTALNVSVENIDFVGNEESSSFALQMLGGRPNVLNCSITHFDNSTGLFIGEDSEYHNTDLFTIHNVVINYCDIGCHMGSDVSPGTTLFDNNAGTVSNLTVSNCRIGLDIKNSNNNNFLSIEADNCSECGIKFTNASYNCFLNPYLECTTNTYFDSDSKHNKIIGSRRYGYVEQNTGNVSDNLIMANSQGKGIDDLLQYVNSQKITVANNSANGYFDINHTGHNLEIKHSQSSGIIDLSNATYPQTTKVDKLNLNSTVALTGVTHNLGALSSVTIPANGIYQQNVVNAAITTNTISGYVYNFWHGNITFGTDLPNGVIATVEAREGMFTLKLYNTTASNITYSSAYTILGIKAYL